MRDLFQLCDYIKIHSSDFKSEIKIQNLRFERPSYDILYWEQKMNTKDAATYKSWFEGNVTRVDSNELTVEFPRELADNTDEKIRLFNYLFGDEGIKNRVLPLPNNIYELIDISMSIVPGSATYRLQGRNIIMRFSTLIQIKGNDCSKANRNLKRGILCKSSKDLETFAAIYHILTNSNGVEFFNGEHGRYVIEKSTDEPTCRRKFQLMYGGRLDMTLFNLLHLAHTFAPQYVPKDTQKFIGKSYHSIFIMQRNSFNCGFTGFKYFGGPQRAVIHYQEGSYFDFKITPQNETAQEYANCLETLGDYFELCEEEVAKSLDETKSFEKSRAMRFGSDNCYVTALLSVTDFHRIGERMLSEIHTMNKIVHAIQKFLEKEVAPFTEDSTSPIFDFAYKKVTLDPLFYSDDTSNFSKFARMLI